MTDDCERSKRAGAIHRDAMLPSQKAARLETLGWNIQRDVAARPPAIPHADIFPISKGLSHLLIPVRDHDMHQQTIEAVVSKRW